MRVLLVAIIAILTFCGSAHAQQPEAHAAKECFTLFGGTKSVCHTTAGEHHVYTYIEVSNGHSLVEVITGKRYGQLLQQSIADRKEKWDEDQAKMRYEEAEECRNWHREYTAPSYCREIIKP